MKKTSLAAILAMAAFFIVVSTTTSCNGNKVYDQYNHTPITGWEKNDTLTFSVPRMTEAAIYSSDLMLRINEDFPFMSVTLIVEQKVIPGMEVKTDTLKCRLIDQKGNFSGQGISYHQYCFPISTMSLVPGDSLQISVRHDMKREILPGVSDVGIKIEKTDRLYPMAKH